MLFFGAIIEDKTAKYSVYLAPFWSIVIIDALAGTPIVLKSVWKIAFGITASTFVLFSLYYQLNDSIHKEQYSNLNRTIGSFLPDGAWCAAPMNFIYDEIGRVNIISNYLVRYETHNTPSSDQLAAFCDRKQARYLVFNRYGERLDDISDFRTDRNHVLSLFDIVVEHSDYIIFRRK
jgi:hypothetical protein